MAHCYFLRNSKRSYETFNKNKISKHTPTVKSLAAAVVAEEKM